MASKTASSKRPQARSQTRKGSSSQDSMKLGLTAEASTFPSDPDLEALEAERAELQSPGQVSGAVAKQIDNDPGYDVDQLTHMAEYWGKDDRGEPGT